MANKLVKFVMKSPKNFNIGVILRGVSKKEYLQESFNNLSTIVVYFDQYAKQWWKYEEVKACE